MAICPECHTTDKPFFAPRCHACNSEIGFWYQLLASYVATATTILGFWFMGGSLLAWEMQWQPLLLWLLLVVGPFAVAYIVVLVGFWRIIFIAGVIFLLTLFL